MPHTVRPMPDELPVMSRLSQVLVAFTIEVDNELERRLPHFTMKYGSSNSGFGSPWLISVVFWMLVLRHVGPGMISVRELVDRSGLSPERISSCVNGLVRWGYVLHHVDPNDARPKPPKVDWVVIPTTNGKRWHETCPIVLDEVERRWEERYGAPVIDALRAELRAQLTDEPLPTFIPFVGADWAASWQPPADDAGASGLATQLSRVLLLHTLDLERSLPLSLAISANVLRVTGDDGVLVREIQQRSGIAKQSADVIVTFLVRHGHATVEPDPGARGAKRVRLTESGRAALDAYERAVHAVDAPDLRRALDAIPVTPAPLFVDGWRAKVKAPDILPHHPIVTGHGGYPDGS